MADTVQCEAHGESQKTYVCIHLADGSTGLGFNHDDASEENPYPDAWCDECEKIRDAHAGWDDVPEGQCKIKLLCCECYEHVRIRNTRTEITLDDLAGLRWKCSNCDEWHSGPVLDIAFDKPDYWTDENANANELNDPSPRSLREPGGTYLDEDFCSIEDRDFFVRGVIELPIIGTGESFRWGVWGSLKRENFERLWKIDDDPQAAELEPMFSWLSSQIADYPDTLSLKLYAHIQGPGKRPHFELQESDHPLAMEYHHGITPERVREITLRHVRTRET